MRRQCSHFLLNPPNTIYRSIRPKVVIVSSNVTAIVISISLLEIHVTICFHTRLLYVQLDKFGGKILTRIIYKGSSTSAHIEQD